MRASVYLLSFLFLATLFWFFRYLSGFVWVLEILFWASMVFFLLSLMHLLRYVFKQKWLHNPRLSNLIWGIVLALALIDFGLRYGTGRWLTWNERNHGFYTSLYAHNGQKWWLHPPDSSLHLENAGASLVRETNPLGLSCPEIPRQKHENTMRVFAFGNSYTEGYSVRPRQTWPARLAQSLRGRMGKSIEMFNVAVSGTDPYFSYRLFTDTLILYKPDVVILALNREDLHKLTYRGGMERFREDGQVGFRPAPWWEPFYKSSMLIRIITEGMGYNDFLMKEEMFRERLYQESTALTALVREWQEKCIAHDIAFIVLFHPIGDGIREGEYAPYMESLITKVKKIPGLPVANALQEMRGKDGLIDQSGLYISPKGHEQIARSVQSFFVYENKR